MIPSSLSMAVNIRLPPKLMEKTQVTARARSSGLMVRGRNLPGLAPAAFLSCLVSKEQGLLSFPVA